MPHPVDPVLLSRLGQAINGTGLTSQPISGSRLADLAHSLSAHGLTVKLSDPYSFQMLSLSGLLLVEVSYLPQIARLYRMKEAREFHVLYPLLNAFGRLIVFVGGILLHQPGITIGMAIGIMIRLILLSQVSYYRHREHREQQRRLEQVAV